jgi:hypothetical protein
MKECHRGACHVGLKACHDGLGRHTMVGGDIALRGEKGKGMPAGSLARARSERIPESE